MLKLFEVRGGRGARRSWVSGHLLVRVPEQLRQCNRKVDQKERQEESGLEQDGNGGLGVTGEDLMSLDSNLNFGNESRMRCQMEVDLSLASSTSMLLFQRAIIMARASSISTSNKTCPTWVSVLAFGSVTVGGRAPTRRLGSLICYVASSALVRY